MFKFGIFIKTCISLAKVHWFELSFILYVCFTLFENTEISKFCVSFVSGLKMVHT